MCTNTMISVSLEVLCVLIRMISVSLEVLCVLIE